MELKNRIMEALNHIQKLTIPRSEDWKEIEKKKEAVKKEEDPTRLAIIYNILKETIADDSEGKKYGMQVRMPDESIKVYPNYAAYKKEIHRDLDECFQRMRGDNEEG